MAHLCSHVGAFAVHLHVPIGMMDKFNKFHMRNVRLFVSHDIINSFYLCMSFYTLAPLYKMGVHYKMVSDIKRFKGESEKCCIQT